MIWYRYIHMNIYIYIYIHIYVYIYVHLHVCVILHRCIFVTACFATCYIDVFASCWSALFDAINWSTGVMYARWDAGRQDRLHMASYDFQSKQKSRGNYAVEFLLQQHKRHGMQAVQLRMIWSLEAACSSGQVGCNICTFLEAAWTDENVYNLSKKWWNKGACFCVFALSVMRVLCRRLSESVWWKSGKARYCLCLFSTMQAMRQIESLTIRVVTYLLFISRCL